MTSEALDDQLIEKDDQIKKLEADLGKLLEAAKTYCEAPAQLRGECYRDLDSTVSWLAGRRENLLGWSAVYERAAKERDEARTEIDALKEILQKFVDFGIHEGSDCSFCNFCCRYLTDQFSEGHAVDCVMTKALEKLR